MTARRTMLGGLLGCFVAAILASGSCGGQPPPGALPSRAPLPSLEPGWRLHREGAAGFVIATPPDWDVRQTDDPFIRLAGEDGSGALLQVGSRAVPISTTSEDYADRWIALVNRQVTIQGSIEDHATLLGGRDAVRLTYRFNEGGVQLTETTYVIVAGASVHVLIFTTPSELASEYEAIMQEIAETFRAFG